MSAGCETKESYANRRNRRAYPRPMVALHAALQPKNRNLRIDVRRILNSGSGLEVARGCDQTGWKKYRDGGRSLRYSGVSECMTQWHERHAIELKSRAVVVPAGPTPLADSVQMNIN